MTSRKGRKSLYLERSLSGLSSEINKWSYSTPSSPLRSDQAPPRKKLRRKTDSALKIETCRSPWYNLYSPRSVAEVAIHKRKLQDVQEALECMLKSSLDTRILILTGPSGASKSTVVSQLAEVLIPEYRRKSANSAMRMQHHSETNETVVEYNSEDSSSMRSFEDFLSHTKYKIGPNLQLILIENMPNVFHNETRLQFRQSLLEWLYAPESVLPPLVVCLTECEIENDSNSDTFGIDYTVSAETILGSEILSHPRTKRIKFNPVNTTLMKKHLSQVCLKNRDSHVWKKKWSQKDAFISQLAQKTGDIRSGISTLEFWATSSVNVPVETRENSVSYFHAIGRILYGSTDFKDDNEMINSMMESFKHYFSQGNSRLGLLENYGSFNKGNFDIATAARITESLSNGNTFDRVPESLEYAIRSVRCALSDVRSDISTNGKSFFPREWRMQLLQEEFKIKSSDYSNVSMYKYGCTRRSNDVALHFGYYDPLIRSSQYYKKKALTHYITQVKDAIQKKQIEKVNCTFPEIEPSVDIMQRIGGGIKPVARQENLISDEDGQRITKISLLQLKEETNIKINSLIKYRENNMNPVDQQTDEDDSFDDPIVDSDQETQESNSFLLEENDDSLYDEFLKENVKSDKQTVVDESLSDSDLEGL
ncbi:hypothetical protein HG535_0G04650 [Zygotorulaspora mrakii]|uniref:Checkpoint protein RAD24-like helical bundle domain-containing protein n=1 Tax=Zygotorulaspora mrakii TaxID=42260 RepID=A0A7H9BA35_ZYGMR|nr:uncharacterized protein HG535_0G04650 [Zygotorulaspora mrakii]QLG74582.1 hypothetical protein HG535_0G04650 [Zygotorulaspora mrakii]